ncbi:N-alpha-acetyltransferase 38, NatC auxiliary subunit isoform X2 [Protopterus annectens]|uniref:N-alpha-acetyltransferase 38, NatC auxiliary subunit isoform X2 n=1 Tax=Protopterus annectens TaxID=7888 RepID=UPI001CFC2887|nr:N-alpha-acetyltransferase 38, NatC auxiliary subunit isoform X2 [Protopterus annectens]
MASSTPLEENGYLVRKSSSEENKDVGSDQESSHYLQARQKLENLLNKNMRIRMTDGRTLIGSFLCTDRNCNIILGSAQEYLKSAVARCETFQSCIPHYTVKKAGTSVASLTDY